MRTYNLILVFLFILPICAFAQIGNTVLKGQIIENTEKDVIIPLIGANAYWLGTTIGAPADINGEFQLTRISKTSRLVVSYIGFVNDTIETSGKNYVTIKLVPSVELEGVDVVQETKSTEVSLLNPLNVVKIGEAELTKAACCNLSESFETTPSVDVSFTDAVTGTRQIQMLGLAGPYAQIMRESMPEVRGLSAVTGLQFIPGTWVESIALSKGAGSVVNGFESIAGQIDVNLREPERMDKLYLNAYGNEGGRYELNGNYRIDINENWGTALLMHAKNNTRRNDRNDDGFLDMPLSDQYIVLNRWKHIGDNGLRAQFGVKGTYIDNIGGQTGFRIDDEGTTKAWGMHQRIERIEAWSKTGVIFPDAKWKSAGLQLSALVHDQESFFGLTRYDAKQQSLYGNFIFQSIIDNTFHNFKTGASIQYDNYEESLDSMGFDREEIVPGVFFEYTYTEFELIDVVVGLRADHHNTYGLFLTPRLHVRYAFNENAVIRASAGRGQRTANVISENSGLLASARQFIVLGDGSDKPFGLEQEVAWNYGLNFTQRFELDYREGSVSLDLYRTDFMNQIVVDVDRNPQQAVFYNLQGESYSNSFQVTLDYEIIKRLDARIAYRWYDVQTSYSGELRDKPLIASHRAFVNLSYSTKNHWALDYTINWQGAKRIPDTDSNPQVYQLAGKSPDFVVMNAQVSKNWNKVFEVYAGVENILNYRQDSPILAADQPFGENFDASLVWGPVFGRNTYAGLRYYIK